MNQLKKNKKKLIQIKNLKKIIVLLALFIVIFLALSLGSYLIAKYFDYDPKYVGVPLFKNFYGPGIWIKFLFIKNISKIARLNQIYLITTTIICLSSLPFLIYMIKTSTGDLDTHGTARWATIAEWKEAGLMSPPGKYTDGVILGRTKGGLFGLLSPRYIIETLKTHIALIAPSRAGKGTGVIIPTLLNWLGSVFVLDMKGENYQITAGYRKKVLGQKVLKFKPYGLEGSVSYNPLAEVRILEAFEIKDATIIADILTDPGEGKKRDHWDTSASALFIGLIIHVLYMRRKEGKIGTFGDIVDFLTSTETTLDNNFASLLEYQHLENEEDIKKWEKIYEKSQLQGVKRGTHPLVARTAAEILNKDERERASVISTVMAKLSLFKDPIIRKNTSRVDFRIKDLMDYETPVSFYVCVEAEQMDTLALLLRILITQMIGILAPEMDFSSDVPIHSHKLLLLMDEFPAFGTIPIFETALAYLAGYNIKALIIAQALNQIKKRYGERNSVFDNCATTVFYSPTPLDTETPKQISEMLGDKTIKIKNKSYKAFQIGSVNISESNQARRLLTPEEVRNKVAGKWNIISVTGLYPMIGIKLEYYNEKYFKSKTNKVYGIPETDYLYSEEIKEEKVDNTVAWKTIREEALEEEEIEKMNSANLEAIERNNFEIEETDSDFLTPEAIVEEINEEQREFMLQTLNNEEIELVDPEED